MRMMMVGRRSVNPSELVIGLAARPRGGMFVLVALTMRIYSIRTTTFTTHALTGEPCHLHRSTVDIRHFT